MIKPSVIAKSNRCPSEEDWTQTLNLDMPEANMAAHLEQCQVCQSTLERLAASATLWQSVRDTLTEPLPDLDRLAASICPLQINRSAEDKSDLEKQAIAAVQEHELQQLRQLLPAASHPELIARIGRYELEQLVGRGGMGLVLRARDTELHRVVAVKTLSMSLWSLGVARERFLREGRAAAMLTHPHIVPIFDVINDSPVPALVMQYVPGPTLDEWIERYGPMPWTDVVRLAAQLADALTAAHEHDLVHRDLKPSNVLLEADASRALLTDFGLVRALDDATLTHSGMLAGTPHFMSPEQARGEVVDGRSDLFSLGALMVFAMTGHPPFRGREAMAVMHAVCTSPHVPLSKLNRDIPIEVSQLVDRLLAKKAARRPATAADVRDQLRSLQAAQRRLRPARLAPKLVRHALATTLLCACGLTLYATRETWQRQSTIAPSLPSGATNVPNAITSRNANAWPVASPTAPVPVAPTDVRFPEPDQASLKISKLQDDFASHWDTLTNQVNELSAAIDNVESNRVSVPLVSSTSSDQQPAFISQVNEMDQLLNTLERNLHGTKR